MTFSRKPLKRPRPEDIATNKDSPSDYTGENASDRVVFLNLWFFKYGTNDKTHGAAVIFSLFLLIAFILITTIDAVTHLERKEFIERSASLLWNAFLLTLGVAIGRGSKERRDE